MTTPGTIPSARASVSLVLTVAGLISFIIPSLLLVAAEEHMPEKIFCLLGITAVFLFFIGLTWRLGLAGLISGAIFLAIIRAHRLKSALMLQPFKIRDVVFFFYQFRANVSILMSYKTLAVKIVLATFALGVAVLVFYRAEKQLGWLRRSRSFALRGVIIAMSILMIPAALKAIETADYGFLLTLKNPQSWKPGSPPHNILSTFMRSRQIVDIKIPERRFSDMSESRRVFERGLPDKPASAHPDIILWHNESSFDPSMLLSCDTPECQFNLYKPDAFTIANGLLKVHCFGGASWTSEFAILTGLNHEVFGEGGIYTHFTLAPRIKYSLPLLLKEQGYRTVALYPDLRHFFNADEAYRSYGFDEFYAPEDMGLPTDPTLVTDQMMYEKMAEILRAEHSGPIFIYVLTQFQHGPHDGPIENLPEPYKSLQFPALSDAERINLANYLYRLSLTDSVMTELDETFLESPGARPTLILRYGDHQPSFDGLMPGMAKRGLDRFPPDTHHLFTQFIMKANFPASIKESREYLDISFLGSLMLDAAALPRDQLFAANAKLRALCDGKYLDCDDRDLIDRYHDYLFYELAAIR